MRPSSAISTKLDGSSSKSIWKRYESIKPEKNQFYCFKTISQILQGNDFNSKSKKLPQKEVYYHKIASPRKYCKQNTNPKQVNKKKIMSIVQRNPNMIKNMSNNFFSNQEIEQEKIPSEQMNIQTQKEVKVIDQDIFLPYRKQAISVVKNSKILADDQNDCPNVGFESVARKKRDMKTYKLNLMQNRKDNKNATQVSKRNNQAKTKKKQNDEEKFSIEQWGDFQEMGQNNAITFSMLLGKY